MNIYLFKVKNTNAKKGMKYVQSYNKDAIWACSLRLTFKAYTSINQNSLKLILTKDSTQQVFTSSKSMEAPEQRVKYA